MFGFHFTVSCMARLNDHKTKGKATWKNFDSQIMWQARCQLDDMLSIYLYMSYDYRCLVMVSNAKYLTATRLRHTDAKSASDV